MADYFNTRISPISPYQKYDLDGNPTVSGPDNRMRWGQWPIILIRAAAELTDNTGYTELRLMGRSLSALADTLSLLLIFLIGRRLYSTRTGLLAAALSALAVMQIQQSHFMTRIILPRCSPRWPCSPPRDRLPARPQIMKPPRFTPGWGWSPCSAWRWAWRWPPRSTWPRWPVWPLSPPVSASRAVDVWQEPAAALRLACHH